jgi:hypothetical protein
MAFTKKSREISLIEAISLFAGGDGLRFCAWLASCHTKNPIRVNRPWRETDDAIEALCLALRDGGDLRGPSIKCIETVRDGFEGTWIRGERAWYFNVHVKGSDTILDSGTCSDLQLALMKTFWKQVEPKAVIMTNDMGF